MHWSLCFLSSSALIIDAAYAQITTTLVFSESTSTGVVWSYSLILEYKNNMVVSASKWRQQHFSTELFSKINKSFIYYLSFIYLSTISVWFHERVQTNFVEWILKNLKKTWRKLLNSFISGKYLSFARNTFFIWLQT